jgi:hypothetical protein
MEKRLHLTSVLTELYLSVLFSLERSISVDEEFEKWLPSLLQEIQNPLLIDLIKYCYSGMVDGSFDQNTYMDLISKNSTYNFQYSNGGVWEYYLDALHMRIEYEN